MKGRILFFLRITLSIISFGFHLTEKLERKGGMSVLLVNPICHSIPRSPYVHHICTYFKLIFAYLPPNYFHLIYLSDYPKISVFNKRFLWIYLQTFYCFKSNLFILYKFLNVLNDGFWYIIFKQPGLIIHAN